MMQSAKTGKAFVGIIIKTPESKYIDNTINDLRVYYKNNASQFVKERNPIQLLKAAESEKVFLIYSDKKEQIGEQDILGVCVVFEYEDEVKELGGIHIHKSLRGYSLQKVLMSLALFVEWSMDPSNTAIAVTDKENIGSIRNIERCGFVLSSEVEIPEAYKNSSGIVEKNNYYLFDFNKEQLKAVSSNLIDVQKNVIERAHGSLNLQLHIPLLSSHNILSVFIDKYGGDQ